MKALSILFGLLLSGYGVVELWFVPSNALPDSAWCRAWFCGTDLETQHEYQEYLQATIKSAPKTVAGFAEILRRDPASAFRWCDLAESMLESGQIEAARYVISRAIVLGPYSAPILLRTANFFFRINDVPRALQFSQKVLGQIPDYDPILFSSYDRFEVPVETVLHEGLPNDRRAVRAYFSHLLGGKRMEDTEATWEWVRGHGFADDQLAASYVSFLLRNAAYAKAQATWADYLGDRRGDYPKANRLFNGDFETQPLSGPFDWQVGTVDGVQISRDNSAAHSGKYAVHLEFAGTTNVALNQITQTAVVASGAYKLEYFVKAKGITTNEGVRLRVFDPENAALLDVVSDAVIGDTDWRQMELSFSVSARTHLVQVQIMRLPSRKFDNKIAGAAWIDTVRLYAAGS